MSDIVIKVENLSKQYRLGELGTGTLSHDLNRWWHKIRGKEDPYLKIGETNDRSIKGNSEYVWALHDINFEVKQGEVLGIIGKNGAGKSTLLKLLSRVTSPTTGSIKAKGRIASLLEVGTGFHEELTGRENIFLNGAILGMTKAEIRSKLDEIVAFSGTERYIDTPVKRYSSGMRVRLAFAVAAHLDPEILIVDEVLAVGDAEFQKKAIGKMQEVSQGQGRTVLFVSHNLNSVITLCNNGLVLKNGQFDFVGNVNNAVDHYLVQNKEQTKIYTSDKNLESQINKIEFAHSDSSDTSNIYSFNEDVLIKIEVLSRVLFIDGTHIGLAILDKWQKKVFSSTYELKQSFFKNSISSIAVTIPKRTLLAGNYKIDVALFIPNGHNFDYVNEGCSFDIIDFESDLSKYSSNDLGSVYVECDWKVI
ncbi:ATP-binding cassette domain-containing protein [Pontibacter sp. KCTC 32443]|uniref:ABC transporter ATP-binding protein n=1 Tax=Pontibacter TaxID=323449 RepID=UPI00164E64CD|nr:MULTISPECIES: ABC transporter ATP-binding protein [Pontibacter]MBC5773505.1 ATP-binding cassette domain-containing protein [Pontibacter sp. KCTC 32443]